MREPVDVTPHEFRHPEAQLFADLHVVASDFEGVRQALAPVLAEGFAKLGGNEVECRWTTALIKYARPFATGVLRWDKEKHLGAMPEELRNRHDRMTDIRGGYIAHSVGSMEDFVPTAIIAVGQESGAKTLWGIGIGSKRIVGPSIAEAQELDDLAAWGLEQLAPVIEAEKARLHEIAKGTAPDELAKGMWEGKIDHRDPRKPRPKFK